MTFSLPSRAARRRVAAIAGALSAGLCGGTLAQDVRPPAGQLSVLQRVEQEFAPEPLRGEGAIIQPAGALDLSYDSNVLARAHVGGDFVASARPEIEMRSELPNHAIGFKAQGEILQYAVHTGENQLNGSAAANGRVDLAPNAYALASATAQRLHEDRGALVPAQGIRPTPYTVVSGTGGLVIEPAPMGIRIDAAVNSYSFENVTGTLGPINETARDRIAYALMPRITYAVVPQYDAFVRAVLNRREYNSTRLLPDGIARNSTGYAGDLGMGFDLRGLTVGEFYVGYLQQDYDRRGLRPIQAVDFGANLVWSPAAATTVRLNLARSVEESTLPGSPGYLQTAVRFAVEQELAKDIVALGSAGFIRADFSPGNSGTNIYEFALGARYFLGGGLTAGVEYVVRHREKMVFLPAYTRQIVGLRLREQL